MARVAGLDLSLRASGIAVIDTETWTGSLSAVEVAHCGMELKDAKSTKAQIGRLLYIRQGILHFLHARSVTHVFIEGYAFGKGNRAHQLGELGGVIRVALVEQLGLTPQVVPVSTARAFFLGRRVKDEKLVVAGALKALGANWTSDEGDAFAIANFGLSELGFKALANALP